MKLEYFVMNISVSGDALLSDQEKLKLIYGEVGELSNSFRALPENGGMSGRRVLCDQPWTII